MEKSRKIALSGVLLALACGFSYLESIIHLPLPLGAKPGLASVVIMFSILRLDLKTTLSLTLLKSVFVLSIRGFTAFLLSLSGGLLSLFIMLILFSFTRSSIVLTSVFGAVSHNIGQLLMVGAFYCQSFFPVLAYAPIMTVTGCITGAFTGSLIGLTLKALDKHHSD